MKKKTRSRNTFKQEHRDKNSTAPGFGRDIAKRLQALSEKLTLKGKRFMLILFVSGSSAYCILLLLGWPGRLTLPRFEGIAKMPVNAIDSKDPGLQSIGRFRAYMDSLYRTDRHRYDSIVSSRPGLIDSIEMVLKK